MPDNTIYVIVAGHCVVKAGGDPLREKDLVLLSEQRDGVHVLLFQQHVRRALRTVKEYRERGWNVVLVFSGGVTRADSPVSEAATYLEIARRLPEWNERFADLVVLDERARDSYENLLFGCAAAFAKSQVVPERVAMISFAFKRRRFEYHAAAIGLMPERLRSGAAGPTPTPVFDFIGEGDPPDLKGALAGEAAALNLFLLDPHGLSAECRAKRAGRNPTGAHPPVVPAGGRWPLLAALLDLNKRYW